MTTKKFVLASVDANSNKYWNITLNPDGNVITEYGRVGNPPQSTDFGPIGSRGFEKKISEKLAKGYREVSLLGDVQDKPPSLNFAVEQIANGNVELEELIKFLIDKNVHSIVSNTTLSYDKTSGLFSTPLGIVSRASIDRAKVILDSAALHIQKKELNNRDFNKLVEEYLMLIPQSVGRMLDPISVLGTQEKLQRQNSILDNLSASLDIVEKEPPKESAPSTEFKVSMTRTSEEEFDRIVKKFNLTYQAMHSSSRLAPTRAWNISIESLVNNFRLEVGNIQELWHGTKNSNLLSILHKGLIIPPKTAPFVTGRLYGNGIYFSDQSTKSLNYSSGFWSRTSEDRCFMLLADVALGRQYTPTSSISTIPSGYDSCFAKAKYSGVINNEMIVYNTNQCNITRLIEFK